MRKINFDHAAASPVMPEVVEAMLPFLTEHYGNAQSIHSLGQIPRQALERAREQVAGLVGASPAEIIFTATASESNNLALKGLAAAKGRGHIVVSAIEHQSILGPARSLAQAGYELTEVSVDRYGLVSPERLTEVLRPDTVLVSIQHANNEIGTVQALAELAGICRRWGVLFHADGTAAVGRIPVDVQALGVDSYAFSAQSFYGPKGAAALYVRTGVKLKPLIEGGMQERGRRAGTENIPAIVGMGKAAELAKQNLPTWAEKMKTLANHLQTELSQKVEHIVFTGHPENRLSGHVSFCVEYVEGEALLLLLDDAGIAAASGSACTARNLKASHVLLALGLSHAVAQSSLALTLGKDTTEEDVARFLTVLPGIVDRLRTMSPLYARFLRGENPYASGGDPDEEGV